MDQLIKTGQSSTNLPAKAGQYVPNNRLTVAENKVLRAASEGKKIGELTDIQLGEFVARMMNDAKKRIGHTSEWAAPEGTIEMIMDDLKSKFFGFRPAEILMAVEMGLNGEFKKTETELLSFTPSNVVRWVKHYREFIKEEAVKRAQALKKAEEEKQMSPANTNKMLLSGLYGHFESLQKNPDYHFEDFGNAYHDCLASMGIVFADKERKLSVYKEETARMKFRVNDFQDRTERVAIKQWLALVEENKARNTSNFFESLVITECKKRVFMDWLKDLAESGIELRELIEGKAKEAAE